MTYSNGDGSYTALSFIEGEDDIMVMVDYKKDGRRIRCDTGAEIPADIRTVTQVESWATSKPLFPPIKEN